MNSLLLWLGILVAAALTAAFAVPFFIDWSNQRDFFEAQASELIGRPVEFSGALEVRVVPFPSLTASDVRIGGAENGSTVERLRVRAALAPLLSGELRVSEMVVTRPNVALTVGENGDIAWGEPLSGRERGLPISAEHAVLESVQVIEGSATVEDRRLGRTFALSDLNAEGTATSLAGPFRLEGGTLVDRERYTFRFATGRIENGRFRLTASLQPAARPLAVSLDGTAIVGEERPGYAGALTIERPAIDGDDSGPWRLRGSVDASPQGIVFRQLDLELGTEEQRLSLGGSANVTFGNAPAFQAALSARQIDLDRTFGGGPEEPVTPLQALARIGASLDPSAFIIPGEISIDVGSMVVSGNLVEGLAADLAVAGDRWRIERAEIALPGATDVGLAGTLRFRSEGPSFDGTLRVSSRQSGALAGWLFPEGARLPGLGATTGPLEGASAVHFAPGRVGFEDLEIETDQARLTGSVAYEAAADGRPAHLSAAIETDRFELAGLSARGEAFGPLAGLVDRLADTELEIDLEAQRLLFGVQEAGGVELSLRIADGDVALERLRVADLAGARVRGEGTINDLTGTPEGALSFDLEADDVDRFATMLRELGYQAAASQLRRRAQAVSPLGVSLRLEARRSETGSRGELVLQGEAGGSAVEATLEFDGSLDDPGAAVVVLAAEVASDDAARLARQVGLDPALAGSGGGRISLAANGRPEEGMPFLLVGEGVGIDGEIDGYARLAGSSAWELSGSADLRVARPSALAGMAGIVLPGDGSFAPLDLTTELSVVGDVWRASEVVATTRAGALRGALAIDLARDMRAIDGRFTADTLDLRWLLSALLGPEAFEPVDGEYGEPAWAQAPFRPVEREGWQGVVEIAAPQVSLGGGFSGGETSVSLEFDADRLAFVDLDADLFGGRLGGALEFATGGGQGVAMEARLELTDARLEDIVWQDEGRAVARGRLSMGIDAEGSGRSFLGLVSTLAGEGSFEVEDAVVRRMNDAAFRRIVEAADRGLELTEDLVSEVFAGHLDSGSLEVGQASGTLNLASGVLRAANAQMDAGGLDAFASATVDLTVMGIDSEWTLRVDAEEADGRSREVGVLFAGPLASPSREIDVTPLLGYLNVRAFEQEVERLERLQSDILERQRFDRERRRLDEERRARARAAEEAAERAAQEAAAREAEEAGPSAPAAPGSGAAGGQSEEDRLRRIIEDALRDSGPAPEVERRPLPAPADTPPPAPSGRAPLDIRPDG